MRFITISQSILETTSGAEQKTVRLELAVFEYKIDMIRGDPKCAICLKTYEPRIG